MMFLHLATRTRSDESDYYSPTTTKWGLETAVDMARKTMDLRNWSHGLLPAQSKCGSVKPKAAFLYIHVFKVLYP